MIRIDKCSDSLLWYKELVGQLVPYLGQVDDIYWSREPAGYRNIVYMKDATIVDNES